ncbi:Adenylyl cyclase-associated protein [Hondaea fermentalgiana]|uniref:Adenylyl cyclase-associated protein n=1 Tax=Hondaea fermentalgiana TaxID=2315210 RepID=A0A2R5GDS2_9STRA|nr:Adenylyl cyclase-associated protein [Hondaea fermentalgiana]|eukprot:GBG28715.1 Adenylyl cyclase-associated protein [Hondaea fermentalgiana]
MGCVQSKEAQALEAKAKMAAVPGPANAIALTSSNKGFGSKAVLRGNQWTVENVGDGRVDVAVQKTTHVVAVRDCKGSDIFLSGKCATVQLDSSSRVSLYVENVIGNVEISNCKSVKVYVNGVVPCITIDKSDGVLVELSKECASNPNFMIVAANSSEMNCAFEFKGEMREVPIPEQFVHKLVDNKKVETSVSSLYH